MYNVPYDKPLFYIFIQKLPCMIEGSLEVKLPTIWTVEKQR